MSTNKKKTPLDLARQTLDDMIGLGALHDAQHVQDLLHHYLEAFEHPWPPYVALEKACGAGEDGDAWPDNIIDEFRRKHPEHHERLHDLSCSVLDYGRAEWRAGYMIGLAMAQRLAAAQETRPAGGAR